MDAKEYLKIFRKKMPLILIITFTSAFISAAISYLVIDPAFKSDISVIIGRIGTGTDSSNPTADYNDLRMYQSLVKTYSELAKSRTIAENVVNKLELGIKPEELKKNILVYPKEDTEFLTIEVIAKDPEQAMSIANQLALSLKEISIKVMKVDNVEILDPAHLPEAPVSPKPVLNITIAFFLGLMVSICLVFFLEYLDNTVKTQEDIERLLIVPVIGIMPNEANIK